MNQVSIFHLNTDREQLVIESQFKQLSIGSRDREGHVEVGMDNDCCGCSYLWLSQDEIKKLIQHLEKQIDHKSQNNK